MKRDPPGTRTLIDGTGSSGSGVTFLDPETRRTAKKLAGALTSPPVPLMPLFLCSSVDFYPFPLLLYQSESSNMLMFIHAALALASKLPNLRGRLSNHAVAWSRRLLMIYQS